MQKTSRASAVDGFKKRRHYCNDFGTPHMHTEEISLQEKGTQMEERLENARRVFDEFFELRKGEKVLFLTDADPESTDRALIDLFKQELERRGCNFRELVAGEETTTEEIAAMLPEYPVIWSSVNWDNTSIDFYALVKKLEETKSRMADSAGIEADALDAGGALTERRETLERRMARMEERLREAAGFHIRTSYGTDLEMTLMPGERKWFADTGVIEPGHWDNIPGGEIFTTPDEGKVEGVLVLPVLQDEVSREQGVDEYVRLTLSHGKIVRIDGGESAAKLRWYLEEKAKAEDDPLSVFQCSEVAFGANEFARMKVRNVGGSHNERGVSVLEAEKRLGTMHVAFGSSTHGEEGTEGHTESDVHIDFVIPRRGLTVTAFYSRGDFRKRRNGQRLINDGSWNFF